MDHTMGVTGPLSLLAIVVCPTPCRSIACRLLTSHCWPLLPLSLRPPPPPECSHCLSRCPLPTLATANNHCDRLLWSLHIFVHHRRSFLSLPLHCLLQSGLLSGAPPTGVSATPVGPPVATPLLHRLLCPPQTH